jgi:hypothetical protein
MTRWLPLFLLASACSSKPPPPAPVPCIAHFSGDVDDTVTATSCGVSSGDAGSTFTAHAGGNNIASFDVSIDLASVGSSWTASATTGDAGCTFTAGSADVPTGSVDLALEPSDGGAAVHGTLTIVMLVHAPAATNCGPHDVENVELTF